MPHAHTMDSYPSRCTADTISRTNKPFPLLLCLALCALMLLPASASKAEYLYRMEGDRLIIPEGVEHIGFRMDESDDDEDGNAPVIAFTDFELRFRSVSLPSSLRSIGGEAFVGYDFAELILPEGLESIAAYAFYACDIGTLYLPNSLKDPGYISYYDCNMRAVAVSEDHPTLMSIDGVLYSKDRSELIYYPNQRMGTHYDVPAGVERIRKAAFADNQELISLSLPQGLREIGDGAFSDCGRLSAIALPMGLERVGAYGFANCFSLERLALPLGVALDEDVFYNCPLLGVPDGYQGDNGETLASLDKPQADDQGFEARWVRYDAILRALPGQAAIPLYGKIPSRSIYYQADELLYSAQAVAVFDDNSGWCEISYALWTEEEPLPQDEEGAWRSGLVKRENLQRLPHNKEFEIVALRPKGGDVRVFAYPWLNADEAPSQPISSLPDRMFWIKEWRGPWVSFSYQRITWEDGYAMGEPVVSWGSNQDFDFLRRPTGDDRSFALAITDGTIRQEPREGSNPVAEVYAGQQLEVLAEEKGCSKVRLGNQIGYLAIGALSLVPQASDSHP